MAGVVIENLSNRKLLVLVAVLLVMQIVCFLVGGLIAPSPTSAHTHLATKCVDPSINLKKPFVPHGPNACSKVSNFDEATRKGIEADWIVFSIQMPHRPNRMDRSFQYMLGVMSLDIVYDQNNAMGENPELTLVILMSYNNNDDASGEWHSLYKVNETRKMTCSFSHEMVKEYVGYNYDCEPIPLFELGTVHHKHYLLNVRLPVVHHGPNKGQNLNQDLGSIQDLTLVEIHQNGGFTLVWFTLKTAMFPLIILAMIWFWKRIVQLARAPVLLERTILALAITISILNLPLEWLTFWHDMPYMLLLGDIRQGACYAMLFSFWIIFVGEHMMDQTERNRLKVYWQQVGSITLGCMCLFVFDMVERGVQLINPFYSIWNTETGRKLAMVFVVLAGICGFLYTIFLIFMVWGVFKNISVKRTALPSMMEARRLHYEGLIFRFRFFMFITLVCALMTAIFFIFSQINEGNWKWGEDEHNIQYSSAFFTGVYGMWNIYVLAVLILYAPSHKKTAPQNVDNSEGSQVEFEMSTNVSSVGSGPSTSAAPRPTPSGAAASAGTSEVYQLLGKVAND
ncbi:protein wntless homolog [Diadema antillarum]|uniref:protein wntless homolog n=1 Tax=Diadema antillarum TaxID=105358 RepID=UPI003A873B86